MNQFTKVFEQCQALLAGMNGQAKLISGLLVTAILVSLGMLVSGNWSHGNGYEYIFNGEKLTAAQLGQIEVAFSTAGLSDWQRSEGRLSIPKEKRSDYYRAISNANAVPSSLNAQLMKELNQTNMFESTRTTEAKQLLFKQKAISEALQKMPNVQEAFLTFDSQRNGLAYKQQKSASVAIVSKDGKGLSRKQAQDIISFLASSFSGLEPANISLLDLSTSTHHSGESDPLAIEADRYYDRKRQQEYDLKIRAQALLADYGDVRVEVNVELDNTASEETSKLNYDAKPTTVQSSVSRKDSDSQKVSSAGRPGTEPNALANRSASISQTPDQTSKTKEQTENTRQVAGNTLSITKKTGWQTKQTSISVLIPFSYYRTAYVGEWMQLNPGQTIDQLPPFDEAALATTRLKVETDIKNVLATIVQTATPGEDKLPNITVTHYVDRQEVAPEELAFAAQAMGWFQSSWQTLLLGVIALAAIVSMRSFAKTTPVAVGDKAFENGFDIPLDDALDIQLTGLDDEGLEALNRSRMGDDDEERIAPRFKVTGPDLKTELTAMVRDNPDAAATLLRNWIGGAQT